MIKGWTGGGHTKTWLHFEKEVSFEEAIVWIEWYSVTKKEKIGEAYEIYFEWNKVAETYKKRALYKWFLEPRWVDYLKFISKRLEPDNAIYVISNWKLYIVEIKFQHVSWSVDEKLQTCDFKNKQYNRLFSWLGIEVEYCYVLSEWFMQPAYRDVLNYIQAVDCHYFFGELPLDFLWLPNIKM